MVGISVAIGQNVVKVSTEQSAKVPPRGSSAGSVELDFFLAIKAGLKPKRKRPKD